jgi:hypothetical protein
VIQDTEWTIKGVEGEKKRKKRRNSSMATE